MKLRRIVNHGILAAILFVSQLILAPLPNIEIVSFLVVVYALSLPLSSSLIIVTIFSILEGLYWGFDTWTIAYFYLWPILVILTFIFKNKLKDPIFAAFLSGGFGLAFGSLTALVTLVLLGYNSMLAYILNGVLFDAVHGFANFMIMLVLHQYIPKVILLIQKSGGFSYETKSR